MFDADEIRDWALENLDAGEADGFIVWCDDRHNDIGDVEDAHREFSAAWRGLYAAERGMYGQLWAAGYMAELADDGVLDIPDSLMPYIDWLSMAQDAELNGEFSSIASESDTNRVHVFVE